MIGRQVPSFAIRDLEGCHFTHWFASASTIWMECNLKHIGGLKSIQITTGQNQRQKFLMRRHVLGSRRGKIKVCLWQGAVSAKRNQKTTAKKTIRTFGRPTSIPLCFAWNLGHRETQSLTHPSSTTLSHTHLACKSYTILWQNRLAAATVKLWKLEKIGLLSCFL